MVHVTFLYLKWTGENMTWMKLEWQNSQQLAKQAKLFADLITTGKQVQLKSKQCEPDTTSTAGMCCDNMRVQPK